MACVNKNKLIINYLHDVKVIKLFVSSVYVHWGQGVISTPSCEKRSTKTWPQRRLTKKMATKAAQGGHGTGKTGKTGNLVLTFSRQGKHRELCCDTGKIFESQVIIFYFGTVQKFTMKIIDYHY